MRLQSRLVLLVILSMVIVSPALAERGERTLRFGLLTCSPTGDLIQIFTAEAQQSIGPAFSAEFMVTDILGIEPSVSWTKHDVDQNAHAIGDFTMIPLMVNANFHVVRKDKIKVYVGPQIGYVLYGDLKEAGGPGEEGLENGFAYGGVVGLDVPIGEGKWMFSASASWVSTDAAFEDPLFTQDLAIDPIVLRIGAGRRF